MDISFERGDPQRPKGHALAYFRTRSDPDKVYATYLIVLPIAVDFAKYVPPFLTSHMGNMPLNDLSAFSLPPMPEEVADVKQLQELAEAREDDLLYAGTTSSADLPEMMEAVGEAVREYSQLWSEYTKSIVEAPEPEPEDDASARVNEVLYSLMSVRDKLTELAKLVGKLRFAAEGSDHQVSSETEEEIEVLGRYLPENYLVPMLLQAVLDSSVKGSRLAQLYMDRCYRLSDGDSEAADDLDQKIKAMNALE